MGDLTLEARRHSRFGRQASCATRLEQVWTAAELYKQGVLSESDWEASYAPAQVRAAAYPFVAAVIRNGPRPPDLKALLLAKVKR